MLRICWEVELKKYRSGREIKVKGGTHCDYHKEGIFKTVNEVNKH